MLTAGLRNILRGCLLAFLATFAGCFLFFTLPDLIASKINKQLPYWFYANEVSSRKLTHRTHSAPEHKQSCSSLTHSKTTQIGTPVWTYSVFNMV